jgi:protein-S-isoprenylcysteine O-methyltransferase Ste14
MHHQQRDGNNNLKIPLSAIIRLSLLPLIMVGILFLTAGTMRWWEAWAYFGMTLVVLISSRVGLILKNPDLALERSSAQSRDNVDEWDKLLMPFIALFMPLLSWIVVGLDKRFSWSPDLPDWIQLAALLILFLGSQLGSWAMIINRFFSSHIRLQTDRGHTVVDAGPYRFVRHPGYAGGMLAWIAAPVFFSSIWVIIPALLALAAYIIRTAREDQFLQDQLPGYKEYAQKVPFRLFPGIW